jgi:nucleotide-binding universal stress UspA family protein
MNPINNILVPVDYSDDAGTALAFAVPLAKAANARLLLFHAFSVQIPPGNGGLGYVPTPSLDDQTKLSIMAMDGFIKNTPSLGEVDYSKKILPGPLIEVLPDVCDEEKIDLIVMGTKGASGLKETFIGSNTARVIEEVSRPVLVIPKESVYRPIRKIAFAYDNTEHQKDEEGRLETLKAIALLFGAPVEVVTVENPKDQDDQETIAANLRDRLKGIESKIHVIVNKNVEKALYDYVNHEHVDLLAILSQKHTFLDRLFRESLTRKLAYHTHTPLLAV